MKSSPFGRWLKSARGFHGVTLDWVSERSGIGKGHLSKIENDPEAGLNVSLATAGKIAGAFGLNLWQVLKRIAEQ